MPNSCPLENLRKYNFKKRHVKCKGEATLHIITSSRKIQKIEKQ